MDNWTRMNGGIPPGSEPPTDTLAMMGKIFLIGAGLVLVALVPWGCLKVLDGTSADPFSEERQRDTGACYYLPMAEVEAEWPVDGGYRQSRSDATCGYDAEVASCAASIELVKWGDRTEFANVMADPEPGDYAPTDASGTTAWSTEWDTLVFQAGDNTFQLTGTLPGCPQVPAGQDVLQAFARGVTQRAD